MMEGKTTSAKLGLLYKDRRLEGETSLRQTQLVQLHLLCVFAKICEDHDIDYWLGFGTLLGALRHGGPIPWDDDADVWMLEKDFPRFCKFAAEELPDDVFLTNPDRFPREDTRLVHLVDAYSMALKRSKKNILVNDHLGINIDIFLMRRVGGRNRFVQTVLRIYETFLWRSRHAAFGKVTLCGLLAKWCLLLCRAGAWCLWSVVQLCCTHKKWLCPFNFNRAWWNSDWHPIETFYGRGNQTKRYADYDGERLRIPVEAEKVLEQLYGDWRRLPPENLRKGYFDIKLPTTSCFSRYAMEYPR